MTEKEPAPASSAAIAGVVWGSMISGLGLASLWKPPALIALAALVMGGLALGRTFSGNARRAFFGVGLILGLPGATVGLLLVLLRYL